MVEIKKLQNYVWCGPHRVKAAVVYMKYSINSIFQFNVHIGRFRIHPQNVFYTVEID